MESVTSTVLGIVVGIATGYYFEWRNTRSTREQNAKLKRQLNAVQEGIYSVGGGEAPRQRSSASSAIDLEPTLLSWMRNYQDPDGTIRRDRLLQRFLRDGVDVVAIDAVLAGLDAKGLIKSGDVIEVR